MNSTRLYTRFLWLSLAFGVCVLAASCSEPAKGPKPLPQEFIQKDTSPQETPEAHVMRRDYRLVEGDTLEIIYHIKHQPNEDYKIKIEDVIVLRCPFNPTLNQTEQVQSDGTLHLDLIGSVNVLDRTIDEVHQMLVQKYSKFVKNPEITISFKQSNVKIEELKKAITTSPRGQSRLVPVTPDGTISLPYVNNIKAASLTVSELHKNLNEAYRQVGLEELEVTVNIQSVAPIQVYVLGEVRIPGALLNRTGAITATREMTLLQALSQAGSYLPARAELSKVMLVRRKNLPQPQAVIVNAYALLENRTMSAGKVTANSANARYDIYLEDGDIIYVPTSDIAKRADFIDFVWTKGIRAVSGFTSNYTVNDAVDWMGPNKAWAH